MAKFRWSLIAALLVLAACGGGGDGDEGSAAAEGDEFNTPVTEDDAGDPVAGGSLTYGTYSESIGYDPTKRSTSYGNPAIYDSLMRFDDAGEVVPYMAESMESDDNVTWTLKLREGVNFHDGTPLDAEAVIFNVERHLDPALASGAFALVEPIESMEAVDDLTVAFTLKRPFAPFAASFAQSNGIGIIASPTAIELHGEDYNLNPVGAGPFTFVEWIPDDRLVLAKNEDYWQEGLPYLDELIYRPIPDTQTRQQAILNGDVDLTYMITATEIIQAQEQPQLTVLSARANGGEGIVLNDNIAPFDDPRMREAFVSILNLDVIADVRYSGQRDLAGAIGLISPDSPVYAPEVEDIWPAQDVERAVELIAEYEADGGDSSFTFVLPNTPDRRAFAEMAGQFFRDADWDVTTEFLDISEFVTGILQTGDFQAAIMSYPAFVGEYPQMWNAYHTTGLSNWAHFSDPDVDAALLEAVSATDPEVATAAWQEVQVLVAEKLPFATYGRPPSAIITQEWVHGVDKYADNTLFPATLWTSE
ncbi:MAG: ABC transporter substrate-binding protein [Acidimicrobiia bacterium]|nr:ABC transporter substrate-binding protein [Acidimicrobiia bacterium]